MAASRVLTSAAGAGRCLTLVAGHLTTGRAVGIDLWRGSDQSGNSALATRRNAEAEGSRQARRHLHGGHARAAALPTARSTLIALQHRHPTTSRAVTIARVPSTKPCACCARRPADCGRHLSAPEYQGSPRRRSACRRVEQRNLGWRMWWGGPWVPDPTRDSEKGPGARRSVARSPSATLVWMPDVFRAASEAAQRPRDDGLGWGRQRTFPRLPSTQDRVFIVAPDARVLAPLLLAAGRRRSHPTFIAAARPRGLERGALHARHGGQRRSPKASTSSC